MTAPAPCSCWDSPVTLHDGHCCMRSVHDQIPTCHVDIARAFRQAAPRVKVDRRGLVTVNGRRYGQVNRDARGYDRMGRPAKASTWQWILVDGSRSPVRYRTRAEALAALVPA